MKKPEMILFDFGHTLCYEEGFDVEKGFAAVMEHAVSNPLGITVGQLSERNEMMFGYLDKRVHDVDIELHHHIYFRALFESLRLEFDVPYSELELIQWEASSPQEMMPGAGRLIDYLNEKEYRTAVVSNMSYSGEALAHRVNELLPRNKFEFILASSEYGWRKPNRFLFDVALAKAGVPAENIWFCGDSAFADVGGAAGVGMIPVWVDSPRYCYYRQKEKKPDCEYLYVRSLDEMITLLESADGR